MPELCRRFHKLELHKPKITKKAKLILPLLYLFDFKAPVWRMALDAEGNRLALEIRDGDVLLAHFYTLELAHFTLTQLNTPEEPAWWLGLEDAHQGMVLLHGYGDRKLGQHKSITALHGPKNQISWQQPAKAFYGISKAGIVLYDPEQPEAGFEIADTSSGEIIQTGLAQQQALQLVEQYTSQRFKKHISPDLYLEGEPYFEQVQVFLEQQLGVTAIAGIEYAETDHAIIISYYTSAGKETWQNKLAAWTLAGELLLQIELAAGLSGIGSDTFFIFEGRLYFIKEKVSLHVYDLI